MITSPSGKRYIGQAQNLNKRLNHYKNLDCKGQRLLYASLLKYGYEGHMVEILECCIPEDLNLKEIQWVSKLKTNIYKHPNLKGMNLCDGGGTVRGHKKTDKEIENMRRRATGVIQSVNCILSKSRVIFDTNTGVYYYGVIDASRILGIPQTTLTRWLNNRGLNKTSLIYA